MRPFTRRQALENAAFLDALRRTGNVRLAARELGVNRSTFTKRRARSAVFAAEWEAALVAAHAAFKLAGGARPPEGTVTFTRRSGKARTAARESDCPPRVAESDCPYRTKGGELMVVRTRNGRLQLRRAPPGRMTKAAEQAFLRALSATANIRLSAAATGFAHSSFYHRRRKWRGFEEEMKLSLRIGYDRLDYAAIERTTEAMAAPEDQAWLAGAIAGNPLPPMSWDQAFQQLCLHQKAVRLGREVSPRPYAGATGLPAALQSIGRKIDAIERASHYEATGSWRLPGEPAPPPLPPLELVAGWSKARKVKAVHNPNLALFGGWRIDDWERRRRAGKG